MASQTTEYLQDGPEAQKIASVIPYYPFHGNDQLFHYTSFVLCCNEKLNHTCDFQVFPGFTTYLV
jgi:hypothetical protein